MTVVDPSSGYTFGHPSGSSTSFSLQDLPKLTELRIGMGWDGDVQGLIPVGPGGGGEPTGYWEAVMEFGPYTHWWRTDGSGHGGDPLDFAWHQDSIDVTITATWYGEMVASANWWLGSASVDRFEAVVGVDVNGDGDFTDVSVPVWRFLFQQNPAGNQLDEDRLDY